MSKSGDSATAAAGRAMLARLSVAVMTAVLAGACTDGKTDKRDSVACNPADAGCRQAGDEGSDGDKAEDDAYGADWLKDVRPLTDQEAVSFLVDQCVDCHDAKSGSVRSFWSLDKDTFAKDKLVLDTMAPTIYMALVMKGKDIIGGKPAAMPPRTLSATEHDQLLRMIKWMEIEMPAAASEAKVRYQGDTGNGVGVVLGFKCSEPASFRTYMVRIVNDAFGREPTAAELALSGHDPDEKTTAQDRAMVSDRLFTDNKWKSEFVAKGLKKFAAKVSGSSDVKPVSGFINDAQAADLKEEFYQLLRANWEASSFRDILLMDKVMVSENTAGLYAGCAAPDQGWKACDLKAPRGSYFSTVGYLAAKPSSLLRENNNYGRAALMHFVVRGDVFRAAFDQDGGVEEVRDLPACLKSADYRGRKTGTQTAWHGAAAIPSSANLCQSCHIERQMAAGAMLYRPFNTAGLIYKTVASTTPEPGFTTLNADADFAAAVAPDMVTQDHLIGPEQQVTEAFLAGLLEGDGEQACIAGRPGEKDLILKDVGDLAAYLIGDGRVLAGGLARHMPRAFSNLDTTSEEIIVKVNEAFAAGSGKLAPVFKAYFGSETYGCK